jgi:potassium efflux system protein
MLRNWLTLFLLLPLMLFAGQPTSEPLTSTENSVASIAIGQIPEEAIVTQRSLDNIAKMLSVPAAISEMNVEIPPTIYSIDTLLQDPFYQSLKSQNIRTLQKHQSEWDAFIQQLDAWSGQLKERIDQLEEQLTILRGYEARWKATKIIATQKHAPAALMEQINTMIDETGTLLLGAREQYNTLLTSFQLVASRQLDIAQRIEDLKVVESELSMRLFDQNDLALPGLFQQHALTPAEWLFQAIQHIDEQSRDVYAYVSNHNSELIIWQMVALGIILLVAYSYFLFIKQRLFVYSETANDKRFFFVRRPISTALLLVGLSSVMIFTDRPVIGTQIIVLAVLIPMVRIQLTVLSREYVPYLMGFVGIFILYFINFNVFENDLLVRIMMLIITALLIALLLRYQRGCRANIASMEPIQRRIVKSLNIFVFLLAVALVANVIGMTLLAERITYSLIRLLMLLFVFHSLTIILTGYVVLILRHRIASASNLMVRYAQRMERNTIFLIKLFMTLWWFWIVVVVFGFKYQALAFRDHILSLTWTVGELTISIQSFFDFVMILAITWIILKALNIILTVEVYSRIKFPRGIPTAITTTLNYVIIILGLVMAFGSLGIKTEQFALILGALGVGIGFGIRNIIANFISGIIMVFERPIQIGDTIEIDGVSGSVLGLGARASTIKTSDGSEVLVPNADFIAKKVTNWTLSDERRRKTLIFKIDFDSDIHHVLEIMKRVALSHQEVLRDPEPVAAFLGFGEYYLEFQLYFWLTRNFTGTTSEIATEIYYELKRAGIKMPMRRQELIQKQI